MLILPPVTQARHGEGFHNVIIEKYGIEKWKVSMPCAFEGMSATPMKLTGLV